MGDLAQSDLVEDLRDPGPSVFRVPQSRQLRQRIEDLFDAVQPPGAEVLRQVSELLTYRPPVAGDVVSADPHRARRRVEQRTDDAHEGALARPVWSEQPEETGAEGQIDTVERGVPPLVGVTEALYLDRRVDR